MQIFGKQVETDKNIDCDANEDENVYKLVNEREKRTESLIKRIKRLQWKQLESHTMEQLESFYKRQTTLREKPPVSNNSCQTSLPPPSPIPLELPLSSTTTNLPASSDNTEVINLLPNNPNHTKPNLPPEVNQLVNNFTPSILDCAEDELLRSAVGIITANLKHLEYSYDSDATESSSGGESCDEFENVFSDTFYKPDTCSNIFEPIERKANWRWLNERSAIASRWTWLQAQVADLEFRIRQQNEMYRQLRASKGSIAFYCKEAPTNNNTSLIPNCLNKSSSITTTPKTSLTSSSSSTVTTTTTSISKPSKPLIQIPPPTPLSSSSSTGNPGPLRISSVTFTSTTTTPSTTTSTTSSTTITPGTATTDALSVDVSSFNFAENSLSDCTGGNNKHLLNLLGSTNGTLNTQTNLSTSSGPNSNGLSDYSLPSVNSDSTISLSPPLETMAPSTSRTTPSPSHTPPPLPSHRLPPSFEDCISTSTNPATTSTPTTFTPNSAPTTFSSCTLSTTATTTITATTTCTTTTSLSITPKKQGSSPMLKDCTPTSEERHDTNHLSTPSTAATTTTTTTSTTINSEKEIHHCARTLPLKQMRKRKLVSSCNAITIASRKIARYSTVQCTCTNYPKFVSPCVLCNGRFSHLQMVDTDCMPNYERYALLDPSYHPVLSLPTDVSLGLYFSKILKKDTATSTPATLSALSSFSTSPAPAKSTNSNNKSNRSAYSEFPFKFGPDTKKTQLNRGKSQAIISSTKLKKKYDGTTRKKYAKKNNNFRKRNLRAKNDQTSGTNEFPSTGSSSNSKIPIHKRRRSEQYAYDIDNIVIPYSIASTTRVEKLQYKEIITPKWRWVETNTEGSKDTINNSSSTCDDGGGGGGGNSNNNNNGNNEQSVVNTSEKNNIFKFDHEADETDEDTSDEAFAIRHAKCEIDERRQRNLHLRQRTTSSSTTTSTTTNHHPQSPPAEIISSSSISLTQNSHSAPTLP